MCQSLTHGFVLIRMAHQLSNKLVFTGQGYLNQGYIEKEIKMITNLYSAFSKVFQCRNMLSVSLLGISLDQR